MEVVYSRCGGLEVCKGNCDGRRCRVSGCGERLAETQTFGTTTRGPGSVLTASLRSTWYWKPGGTLLLVNTRHVDIVSGRKPQD